MTLFNVLSIVLSVVLATVITAFSVGVRRYVADLVRKEAAAGAVRAHYGDVLVVESRMSFAEAEIELLARLGSQKYVMHNVWSRSESHQLLAMNPLDGGRRGVFTPLGNTFVGDPEKERVSDFRVAGGWIDSDAVDEIVMSLAAAKALLLHFPELSEVDGLVGKDIWLALPPTSDHDSTPSAQVKVSGIFNYLRDGACMTTESVIQKMHSRTLANANGRWWETYDRMQYRVSSMTIGDWTMAAEEGQRIPMLCHRIRETQEKWFYIGGKLRDTLPSDGNTNCLITLGLMDHSLGENQWTYHGKLQESLPESESISLMDTESLYPDGFVLCSPRVWNEAGFDAAPVAFDSSWRTSAHYAYFYFTDLASAMEGRRLLQRFGLATFMPIDRFSGLLGLVQIATVVALALMATVLTAGTLGIVVTLYTEVDAGSAEIGLMKALGASNGLVGFIFLLKGAFVGLLGVTFGIPVGIWLGGVINTELATSIAEQAGLEASGMSLFQYDPTVLTIVGAGIVLLAALAALAPSLLAARKDPQESLREE